MTACSMLHSLFMRAKEPLLADMIRKILRDEARHAAFSYEVTGAVLAGQSRAARLEMEDMLFESVVACISGFLPIAAWREEGFSIPECRQAAVRALAEARVFDFYGRVFPQCLERYGLATDRLRALVAEDLPRRVEGDAIA
jgi:hypothetical protein